MWWVKNNPDHSRGGFQNRDVGRTSFGNDFGPDYGVDFARFSDPPNLANDARLYARVSNRIFTHFAEELKGLEIFVRNGFVIIKGEVSSEGIRKEIEEDIRYMSGVLEVVNSISISTTGRDL